jgi:hypothetical protein
MPRILCVHITLSDISILCDLHDFRTLGLLEFFLHHPLFHLSVKLVNPQIFGFRRFLPHYSVILLKFESVKYWDNDPPWLQIFAALELKASEKFTPSSPISSKCRIPKISSALSLRHSGASSFGRFKIFFPQFL